MTVAIPKTIKKDGCWVDSRGQHIPTSRLTATEKKREKMVSKCVAAAMKEEARLAELRKIIMAEIGSFLDHLVAENGQDILNDGGNYRFTGFSGNMRLELKVDKFYDFDERIQLVEKQLKECQERWLSKVKGASADEKNNMRVGLSEAFRLNSNGKLRISKVLELRKYPIKDEGWQKAIDLLLDALFISGTKQQIIIWVRDDRAADWRKVQLNLNAQG